MTEENLKLIKTGDLMSLRTRIEALSNGWNKEADDILEEIYIKKYDIAFVNISKSIGRIVIIDYNKENRNIYNSTTTEVEFAYESQYSKMTAFKNALLWLLDKSELKRHSAGDEIKIESEGKTYKVKIVEEC